MLSSCCPGLKKAEVEVKYRSGSCFLNPSLNLNLPIPLTEFFRILLYVKTLLPMERQRTIDLYPDAFGIKMGLELVSIRHTITNRLQISLGNTGFIL